MPLDPIDHDPAEPDGDRQDPSLREDVGALFTDAKTYLDAEIAFQKSRAGYSAGQIKFAAIYGAGALALFHLALIAFTVGMVIALASLVGPWLATAIVVLVFLLGAAFLAFKVRSRIAAVSTLFGEGQA